jgi:hypothetical protein
VRTSPASGMRSASQIDRASRQAASASRGRPTTRVEWFPFHPYPAFIVV